MTAEDKIREAEHNFSKLPELVNDEQKFQYELSNFLGSCYSILQHLLEDHRNNCGLIIDFVTIKTFLDEANKTHNANAIKFIKWYDKEQKLLRNNSSYGFLWARRHISVHKTTVKPEGSISLELGITPIWRDIQTHELTDGDQEIKKHTWRYFNENKNEDVIVICNNFLAHIKKIVNDSKLT